ncbi:hypothetical protein B0H14DRAFT_2609411 [Mycena olivaceomarginata]|nr:hypothetical protein B0H14DRAFT_2609411 [Mycena olivaceomarginata]
MEWQTNAAQINPIFFLVYNLLGAVVILTLFVRSGHPLLLGSIIIGNFSSKKGSAFLTAAQRGVAPLAFVSAHEYVPGRDQASRSVARSATYSVLSKTALGGVIDLSTVCRAYDPSRAPQRETPAHHAQAQPLLRPRPNKGRARHHAQAAVRQQQHRLAPHAAAVTVFDSARAGAATSSRPTRDPWTAPVTQTTPARSASQAPPLPPQQSQSFRGEEATAAPPSANEWMANYDPWTSGGDENQNYDQQQSQKQFEPEKKREAPSSIRGGLSPFRDRVNRQTDPQSFQQRRICKTFLMSAVTRKPLADVARERPQRRPDRAPVEFNYFLHSETLTGRAPAPEPLARTRFRLRRISSLHARAISATLRRPRVFFGQLPRLEVVLVPMGGAASPSPCPSPVPAALKLRPTRCTRRERPPPTLCSLRTLFLRAHVPPRATPAPARWRGHHDVPPPRPTRQGSLPTTPRCWACTPAARTAPLPPAIGADVRPERRKSGRAALRSDDAPPLQSSEASPEARPVGAAADGPGATVTPQLRDDDVPRARAPADALVLFHRSPLAGASRFSSAVGRPVSPKQLAWLSRRGSPRITPHKVIRAAGGGRDDLASREPLGGKGKGFEGALSWWRVVVVERSACANGLVLPLATMLNGSGNEHGGGANNANGTANGPPPSTFSRSWDRDQHQRMLMQQVQLLTYSGSTCKNSSSASGHQNDRERGPHGQLVGPRRRVFPAILERTKQTRKPFSTSTQANPFPPWPSNSFYAQAYLGGLRVAAALRHADAQLSHMVEELSAFTMSIGSKRCRRGARRSTRPPGFEGDVPFAGCGSQLGIKILISDIQRYQYTVLSEIERQGKRGFLSHKNSVCPIEDSK